MSRTATTLRDMYDALLAACGPQGWWPAKTPTEVIIGAILTQNTAWRNVERAIASLRAAGALDWAVLRDMDFQGLAELVRPAGTFNVKARRLKAFVSWLWEHFDGSLERMFQAPLHALREQLLGVSGIGRETADAILLYAGNLPTFVVDAYTARILNRHRLIDADTGYEEIKDLFESHLPQEPTIYNEYHALLVQVGKTHCRPRPRCEGCPLERFPHEVEATSGE